MKSILPCNIFGPKTSAEQTGGICDAGSLGSIMDGERQSIINIINDYFFFALVTAVYNKRRVSILVGVLGSMICTSSFSLPCDLWTVIA